MAELHLLLVMLLTYSTYFVKSAPSQLSKTTVAASGPEHGIQELATSDTFRTTATSNSNSNSNGVKTTSTSNAISNQDVDEASKGSSKDTLTHQADIDGEKTGSRSSVMTLSDDVITDALFTNIDTLQDHLEVCEEGLRQQLRLHTHGKLLQEVTAEETDYTNNKGAVDNKENKNDGKFEDDEDADDEDETETASEKNTDAEFNGDMMADDKDGVESTNMKVPSIRETKNAPVRRRRSLAESAKRPSGKDDNMAQKIVTRLSDRLEYLKASLIQCHLLYRQFELV